MGCTVSRFPPIYVLDAVPCPRSDHLIRSYKVFITAEYLYHTTFENIPSYVCCNCCIWTISYFPLQSTAMLDYGELGHRALPPAEKEAKIGQGKEYSMLIFIASKL